jgi:hypothetical protein
MHARYGGRAPSGVSRRMQVARTEPRDRDSAGRNVPISGRDMKEDGMQGTVCKTVPLDLTERSVAQHHDAYDHRDHHDAHRPAASGHYRKKSTIERLFDFD